MLREGAGPPQTRARQLRFQPREKEPPAARSASCGSLRAARSLLRPRARERLARASPSSTMLRVLAAAAVWSGQLRGSSAQTCTIGNDIDVSPSTCSSTSCSSYTTIGNAYVSSAPGGGQGGVQITQKEMDILIDSRAKALTSYE